MEFASAPWMWLGLAGIIPLVLHWLQRGSNREIAFAASRWLTQQPQQRWRRLQLREKFLLLLRLLVIALLTILLAQPMLTTHDSGYQHILVDPTLSREDARAFVASRLAADLGHNSEFSLFWLTSPPRPLSDPPPRAWGADVRWQTLTALAGHPALRNAHVLLPAQAGQAHDPVLRASPGWQWHQLEVNPEQPPTGLKLAVVGGAPGWLFPMLAQLEHDGEAVPDARALNSAREIETSSPDWLIYSGTGELPPVLVTFIRDGGLLITDSRVTADQIRGWDANKSVTGTAPAYHLRTLGQGSWLQYSGSWDSANFFKDNRFPATTWRQWRQLDWPLQRQTRAHWTPGQLPALQVSADKETTGHLPLALWSLLVALAALLGLERVMALSLARAVRAKDSGVAE